MKPWTKIAVRRWLRRINDLLQSIARHQITWMRGYPGALRCPFIDDESLRIAKASIERLLADFESGQTLEAAELERLDRAVDAVEARLLEWGPRED